MDELVAVPYFDGLMAGEPDALVESFAAEPELHDPVYGRVKGTPAFRAFVTEMNAWMVRHNVSVEDVEHVVTERRGFEEVVLHLDGETGPVDLPVTVVADREADGRIDELRIYFSSWPALLLRAAVLERRRHPARHCALIDDKRVCVLEYNVVRWGKTKLPPQAGVAVYVRGQSGKIAAARIYDDADSPIGPRD